MSIEVNTTRPKVQYLNNKELLLAISESKLQGKMTDKLARMFQLLCAKYAAKGNFVNYCVDKETEALTQRGWVNGIDITNRDTVLSYEVDTENLVWSKIFEVYKNYEYSGLMHHLTTRGLDALVTPNHKFVSSSRGIIPVEDISNSESIVLMGNPVQQDVITYSDYLVELVGWSIMEGSYINRPTNMHSIYISHQVKSKADRTRELLHYLEVPYEEYTSKQGTYLFDYSGPVVQDICHHLAPDKILSSNFILSLTQSQRLLLISIMGSETMCTSRLSYSHEYSTHVDAFLMLCTVAGLTTHTSTRGVLTYVTVGTETVCSTTQSPQNTTTDVVVYNTPTLQCKAQDIIFHGVGASGDGSEKKPTVQYNGLVWCPVTEYGTFVCRRNGEIYITGNTYNSDMQAYAMMMLVRTWNSFDVNKSNNPFAFFTQCIKHSFIQYLNREKRQRIVRDLLLVDQGLNPSFGFMEEASDQHFVEDEQDYFHYQETANELQQMMQHDPLIDELDINTVEEIEELETDEAQEYNPLLQ